MSKGKENLVSGFTKLEVSDEDINSVVDNLFCPRIPLENNTIYSLAVVSNILCVGLKDGTISLYD